MHTYFQKMTNIALQILVGLIVLVLMLIIVDIVCAIQVHTTYDERTLREKRFNVNILFIQVQQATIVEHCTF